MNGADGLKQHFAEISFFSRARNTGKMGEVVDKLKANLRQVTFDDCNINGSICLCIHEYTQMLHLCLLHCLPLANSTGATKTAT